MSVSTALEAKRQLDLYQHNAEQRVEQSQGYYIYIYYIYILYTSITPNSALNSPKDTFATPSTTAA